MPTAPISFANQQATGNEALAGAPGVAMNVVVDGSGAISRRPGIQASPGVYSGLVDAAGISGLYTTLGGDLFAVGATPFFRQIYNVGATSAVPVGTATGDTTLAGASRPTFAETQLLLVLAGSDKMQKIILATGVSSRLGGDPPFASHVTANSSRLLGNLANVSATNTFDKSVVRFSDIANGNASFAGMEVWTEGSGTAGHFSAEADPDPVVAIYENTNEVFCFGSASLQIFDPDPTTTYAPTTTREVGCAAPYSVVKINQQFAWLDNLRRFIISDGRSDNDISGPIKGTLDAMGRTDDCFGYRVFSGALDALVWTFPTDGRTFAFQRGSGWAEWSGWNDATNNWAPFTVTAHHLAPTTHDDIVGTSAGFIGRFDVNTSTDLGTRINARVETGYMGRQTDAKKHCKCVRVSLRRGASFGAVGPQAYLSWRDRPGPYGNPIAIDLGGQGDTEIVVPFRSLGVYRRRQWLFEFSGTEDLTLLGVEEDFDVLDS